VAIARSIGGQAVRIIDAGIIPEDILSDEKVLNSLPLFFRTIRSEKPTPEDLDKLINMIRKE
jgi:hypothetical protein